MGNDAVLSVQFQGAVNAEWGTLCFFVQYRRLEVPIGRGRRKEDEVRGFQRPRYIEGVFQCSVGMVKCRVRVFVASVDMCDRRHVNDDIGFNFSYSFRELMIIPGIHRKDGNLGPLKKIEPLQHHLAVEREYFGAVRQKRGEVV
ncbi:hypothetical protein LCGC14_2771540, partial [marine sediment metagenome]